MTLKSFHLFHLRTTTSLMLLVEMETMAGCEYSGNIYEKVIHSFTDHKMIVGHGLSRNENMLYSPSCYFQTFIFFLL